MNKLITISGSSGVGKSTLSHLFSLTLGQHNCLCVSGDDLHRWERSDEMWKIHTHLNPLSNDLQLGHNHINQLKRRQSIKRRRYNHDTGKFDEPVLIEPKPFIVFEGLHTMYLQEDRELADLKIFVDTDDSLKTEWKIRRDTKKRGYTRDQVMQTIMRRKIDEEKYILPQKEYADIVVSFARRRDGRVNLNYVCTTGRGKDIMAKVAEFYNSMVDFTELCKWLSLEPSLIQGKGGNVSCKTSDSMIVTSSGSKMSDVTFNHGYSVCKLQNIPSFTTEKEYTDSILASKIFGDGRPSMESGFHMKIKSRVVVHTHPIHLNSILCSKECDDILNIVFKDIAFYLIDYTTPGFELCNNITEYRNIVFLKNHGLIVGADSAEEAFEITERINNRCKRWIAVHVDSFTEDTEIYSDPPVFPDAAIFSEELSPINTYITRMIREVGLTPSPLTPDEVVKLKNMDAEKYRQSNS